MNFKWQQQRITLNFVTLSEVIVCLPKQTGSICVFYCYRKLLFLSQLKFLPKPINSHNVIKISFTAQQISFHSGKYSNFQPLWLVVNSKNNEKSKNVLLKRRCFIVDVQKRLLPRALYLTAKWSKEDKRELLLSCLIAGAS